MPSFPDRGRQAGFTLIEVLVATAVLSLLVLLSVRLGGVYGGMAGNLLLRQKAVFVLDAEMERLSALYATTGFGALSLPQASLYPALPGLPNSSMRWSYLAGNSLTPFVTTSAATAAGADTFIWSTGGVNFVWLDRDRGAMARISWILCPISKTTIATCWGGKDGPGNGTAGAFVCFDAAGLGLGGSCQLLILVLDFPYWQQGGSAVAAATSNTLTLSTIVGRRR